MDHRYRIIAGHIGAWLVYLLILFLGTEKPGFNFWLNTICTMIPTIILFYLSIYFLFPKYLEKRKFITLAGLLVVLNLVTICLRFLLPVPLQQTGIKSFTDSIVSPVRFWNHFRVNLLFIGISFAYWYAKEKNKAEKKQQKMEQEILHARLNLLKSQINPHFLYNTLSFIYTRSLPHSRELANAIVCLSEMMRYSLGETGDDGKASLEKEIMYIKHFIKIQQMRFDNKLKVSFEANGALQRHRVMPLLLITLVENAFKHGKLNDTEYPLVIRLNVSEQGILFTIQNRKTNEAKGDSDGMGLKNIRSRLELAYPGQHEFIIDNRDEEFIVNLKLFGEL